MRKFIAFFTGTILLSACAQIKVSSLSEKSTGQEGGIVYKLPRTCIAFQVVVKTITYTANPCLQYNLEFVPASVDKAIIKQLLKDTTFSVRKVVGLEVATMPVDDPDKYFLINTNKKIFQERTYGLATTGQGFITTGNLEVKDNTFDAITQLVSSAASFVSPVIGPRGAAPLTDLVKQKEQKDCNEVARSFSQVQAEKYQFMQLKTLQAGAPISAETYQRVMDGFEKTELDLFNNAFFTTEIEKNSCIIFYTPGNDAESVSDKPFFTYDPDKDLIMINRDLPGSVTVLNSGITDINKGGESELLTHKAQLRRLSIYPAAMNSTVTSNLGKLQSGKSEGLYYNIPRQCRLTVNRDGKTPFLQQSIALPQWGVLGRLSGNMSKVAAVFNPETGALLSVNMESKGVSAEQVKNAFAAAEKARDLVVRDKDAEELARLDKQIKLLEAKDKLAQLQAGEPEELIALRKEAALLAEKKNVAELKLAIKKLEKEE